MTISVGNTRLSDTVAPSSPVTLAYSSNPTVNNGLLVTLQIDSGLTVNTPTDTQTNTYTLLAHASGSGTSTFDVYVWLAAKNKATGANTVSITYTGTATFWAIRISELSDSGGNASGFSGDQSAVHASASESNPSVTTPTTTVANELVYGSMVTNSINGTAGSGFTGILPGVNTSGQDEWKTVTSIGTQVINFTAAGVADSLAGVTIFTVTSTTKGSILPLMGVG